MAGYQIPTEDSIPELVSQVAVKPTFEYNLSITGPPRTTPWGMFVWDSSLRTVYSLNRYVFSSATEFYGHVTSNQIMTLFTNWCNAAQSKPQEVLAEMGYSVISSSQVSPHVKVANRTLQHTLYKNNSVLMHIEVECKNAKLHMVCISLMSILAAVNMSKATDMCV